MRLLGKIRAILDVEIKPGFILAPATNVMTGFILKSFTFSKGVFDCEVELLVDSEIPKDFNPLDATQTFIIIGCLQGSPANGGKVEKPLDVLEEVIKLKNKFVKEQYYAPAADLRDLELKIRRND